jgi:phosphoglycerate dehydrogenase-like enzyme
LVVTAATQHLLNAHKLALMQAGSLLVNTSRSALVEGAALVDALK